MKISIQASLLIAGAVSIATAAHAADDPALLKRLTDAAKVLRMISPNPKNFELLNVQYDAPRDVICVLGGDKTAPGKVIPGQKLAGNSAGKSIPWTDTCEKNAGTDWTARVKAQL